MRTSKIPPESDSDYMGSGVLITKAIEKYGKVNFTKRILSVFDNRDDMIAEEVSIVNIDFVTREDTYNIALGGLGGDKWSAQTDQSIRDAHRQACIKNNRSQDFRDKLSKSSKKRFESMDARKAISDAVRIKLKEPEVKERMMEGIRTRVFPESWYISMRDPKLSKERSERMKETSRLAPVFTCPICSKCIKGKGNLSQHIASHVRKGLIDDETASTALSKFDV